MKKSKDFKEMTESNSANNGLGDLEQAANIMESMAAQTDDEVSS